MIEQTKENYSASIDGRLYSRFYAKKMEWILGAIVSFLKRNPDKREIKILDLGCGQGLFLKLFKEVLESDGRLQGIQMKMIGVDLHAPRQSNDKSITYQQSTVLDERGSWVSDEEYDVVLLLDFVEHIYEQKKLFLLVSRVLNSTGVAIIETADVTHLYARLVKYNYYYTALADHVVVHSPQSIRMIAHRVGMHITLVKRTYHQRQRLFHYLSNVIKSIAHLGLNRVPYFLFPVNYFPKGYGFKDHMLVFLEKKDFSDSPMG